MTTRIKQESLRLGFDHCGIAKAERLEEDERRLENWLNQNHHGKMSYMENHFDKRVDPRKLVEGAKSVITLSFNYFPSKHQNENTPKISKYAFGLDYHFVIKNKINELLESIREGFGNVQGRGFVDSAPVLERAWAVKSGMGWIGKNGNLISKSEGSFFFLATLIVDIELEYDSPFVKDFCGTCTKCIEACPTEAILPNKEINGSQCISYFTIELKDAIIDSEKKWDNWIFGCDICQDVCPWNRFSKSHQHEEFSPMKEILEFDLNQWKTFGKDAFNLRFKNSPMKRTMYSGILRNIEFIQ